MRAESQPTAQQMMLNMNLWSFIFTGASVFITEEYFHFINFIKRHPTVILNIGLFSVAGTVGQLFIFLMVS